MKNSILNSTFSRVLGLTLCAAAFFFLAFPKEQQPKPLVKEGPGHPGWQEDWLLLKKEEGRDLPDNFTLEMYKRFHLNKSENRTQESNFANVEELGPTTVAGRIRAFVVDHSNHDRYLAAGISGGIWESLDRGVTWTNLTPKNDFLNITSITQSPFDANIFYFATGEATGNSANIDGVGLFKSTDGAQTFEIIPASMVSPFFSSWRIAHSQTDPNTVYIATPSGFFVTRDGGEFFDQILFDHCTDIEILPSGEMYVGTNGDGVYFSANGNDDSFTKVSSGFGNHGRIELATSANNPNVIVAALANPNDGTLLNIFYSDDYGDTWEMTNNPSPNILSANFAWYCNTLFVHPTDPSFIIFGASDGGYSFNRGITWQPLFEIHADIHTAMVDPANPDQLLLTSDGGVDRFERVQTAGVDHLENLNNGINITQFYTGALFPNGDLLGGTQDNGTWYMNKNTKEFEKVFGADGSFCAVNPIDSNQVYVSYQNANVLRIDNFYGGGGTSFISGDVINSDDDQYFIAPFQLNPHQPNQLFLATEDNMWWSQNSGDSWSQLTENVANPYRLVTIPRQNVMTAFVTGARRAFYRIDDLNSHVAGEEIDLRISAPADLRFSFIREVIASPDGEALYVALSTFAPFGRVWKITNIYGETPEWESVSGDLPESLPVNTIRIDEENTDIMAVGTDYGLFTTKNGGENWILEDEIPQTVISQIIFDDTKDLQIFTHGRGIFKAKFKTFLSTENNDNNQIEFQIGPNPTTDVINLSGIELNDVASINIFDVAGKSHVESTEESTEIDVSNLAVGSYILQVRLKNGGQGSKQFIKK